MSADVDGDSAGGLGTAMKAWTLAKRKSLNVLSQERKDLIIKV